MSLTQHVTVDDQTIWALDVALGVLLKHVIDVAETRHAPPKEAWLEEAIDHWRHVSVINDIGLHFDERWPQDRRAMVAAMIREACNVLSARTEIPSEEITSWRFVEDFEIFPRGLNSVPTRWVIELGHEICRLLEGTMPKAPPGKSWYCGFHNGTQLLPP